MDNALKGQVAIPQRSAASSHLRGQVATEFFLYVSVFLFVAIAAFFIVDKVQSTEIPQREATVARDTGEIFQSSITLAVKAGKGFAYRYAFPRTILGNNYTITFAPDKYAMVLDWEGRYGNFSQYYSLPTYSYDIQTGAGQCIKQVSGSTNTYVLHSAAGSDTLTLLNDGGALHISQGGVCP